MDVALLTEFLKEAGVLERIRGKRYTRELREARIILQERRNTGRTDLIIHWPGAYVVVEAKVGRGQPTACQLLHYTTGCNIPAHHGRPTPSPWVEANRRFIVTLTTGALDDHTQREVLARLTAETAADYAGIELRRLTWESVYSVVRQRAGDPHSDASFAWAVNEFMTFFREDYQMPYYDAEVLVQDIFGEQYDVFANFHLYRRNCKGPSAPLYFAPYHTHGGGGVTAVARCLRVIDDTVDSGLASRMHAALATTPDFELHWARWRQGLEFSIQNDANGSMMRFFFLDEPQPLERRIQKRPGMTMLPIGYKKTFQELLRDTTL